jgi:hypothetical protein
MAVTSEDFDENKNVLMAVPVELDEKMARI